MRPREWAVLCAVLALVSCSGEGRLDPIDDNVVRYYISGEPASLSLIGKTDVNAEILAVQISDSLLQYDSELKLQPRLATGWSFSEDRLQLRFDLRRGVRWHDGAEFTADDVVFTVHKVREAAVENRVWGPLFADLVSVEALDPYTIRATYSTATADVLEGWRLPILPVHVAGRDEDLLTGSFAKHPIGCGPFRFLRHEPGHEIVLEANEQYWDGAPEIDRLLLKIYPDQRTAFQALRAGDLDIMTVTSNIWNEAQNDAQSDKLDGLVMSQLSSWIIGWNPRGANGAFTDPRVRRAMVLALDRELFIDSVLFGLARPGATTYHPGTAWADPEVLPLPYDPRRAQRLLEESGWTDSDGDGVRDRDGRPLAFSLLIPVSNQKLADHLAAWQQQSWADVGIRMQIDRSEWQVMRQRRNAGQYDAVSHTMKFTPVPDQKELLHSSSRPDAGGMNFVQLSDPEVDRLVDAGRETFEFERRLPIYHALQHRLAELEAITCLFYFDSPVLYDKRLTGVVGTPLGLASTMQGPRQWSWTPNGARGD